MIAESCGALYHHQYTRSVSLVKLLTRMPTLPVTFAKHCGRPSDPGPAFTESPPQDDADCGAVDDDDEPQAVASANPALRRHRQRRALPEEVRGIRARRPDAGRRALVVQDGTMLVMAVAPS